MFRETLRTLGLTLFVVTFALLESPIRADEATVRVLKELQQIQGRYWKDALFPATLNRPDAMQPFVKNKTKREALARLPKGGDSQLRAMIDEAVKHSLKVEKRYQELTDSAEGKAKDAVKTAGPTANDPDQVRSWIKLLGATYDLQKLNKEVAAWEHEEADFERRWNQRLTELSRTSPSLKTYANEPESCNPSAGVHWPTLEFPTESIGQSRDNPYRLDSLRDPIIVPVEPTSAGTWRNMYAVTMPQDGLLNVRIVSRSGLAHASLWMKGDKQWGEANVFANSSQGRAETLQMPVKKGQAIQIAIYHIEKPVFGPEWTGADVEMTAWLGASAPTNPQRLTINAKQQTLRATRVKQTAEEQHRRLQETTLQLLQTNPTFSGKYEEDRRLHPFTLKLEFNPASKAITGTVDWPTFRGATKFRGTVVKTSGDQIVITTDGEPLKLLDAGWELTFEEIDFLPGKKGNLIIGTQYALRPKWENETDYVLVGICRLKQGNVERVHEVQMRPSTEGLARAATMPKLPVIAADPPAPASQPDFVSEKAVSSKVFEKLPKIARPPRTLAQHEAGEMHVFESVKSYDGVPAVVFTRDGKGIATGNRLLIWDLNKRSQLADLDYYSKKCELAQTSTTVAFTAMTGSASQSVFVTKVGSKSIPGNFGEMPRLNSLALSPNGAHVAAGSEAKDVAVIDTSSRKPPITLPVGGETTALALTNGGKLLLTAEPGQGIRVWDVAGKALRGQFKGHGQSRIHLIAPSTDQKLVISASTPANSGPVTVILWDRESLAELHSATMGERVRSVAISSDWRYALIGEESGALALGRIDTGETVQEFEGHTAAVTALTFSPCWSYALSGAADDTVRLWGLKTSD